MLEPAITTFGADYQKAYIPVDREPALLFEYTISSGADYSDSSAERRWQVLVREVGKLYWEVFTDDVSDLVTARRIVQEMDAFEIRAAQNRKV